MDILIGGAGVIPQLFPAVRAVDEIAEDALRSVFLLRRAALGLADQLLHFFEGGAVDDRFVHVAEYELFFLRRFKTLLVFEGLGVGLTLSPASLGKSSSYRSSIGGSWNTQFFATS